ncbi:MAG: metallophosphoesterase [Clostridia bacterium]|nr:metallophosphoesterase [Clostridia bacterium]
MSLFTMADLHLSLGHDHKMDVFGSRWQGYTEKIEKRWRAVVGPTDTVIVPGDISWAINLTEATKDFAFLDALPGKKLLGKGNHDFWWDTATKCGKYFAEHGFSTLSLLYNNATVVEDFIVTGTRGWFLEKNQQITVGEVDYDKIMNRELLRLKIGLDAAKKLQENGHAGKEILVFLHFPPVWGDFVAKPFLDALREAGVKRVFFGHIHGNYVTSGRVLTEGLEMRLIASDFLDFTPQLIRPLS